MAEYIDVTVLSGTQRLSEQADEYFFSGQIESHTDMGSISYSWECSVRHRPEDRELVAQVDNFEKILQS